VLRAHRVEGLGFQFTTFRNWSLDLVAFLADGNHLAPGAGWIDQRPTPPYAVCEFVFGLYFFVSYCLRHTHTQFWGKLTEKKIKVCSCLSLTWTRALASPNSGRARTLILNWLALGPPRPCSVSAGKET